MIEIPLCAWESRLRRQFDIYSFVATSTSRIPNSPLQVISYLSRYRWGLLLERIDQVTGDAVSCLWVNFWGCTKTHENPRQSAFSLVVSFCCCLCPCEMSRGQCEKPFRSAITTTTTSAAAGKKKTQQVEL